MKQYIEHVDYDVHSLPMVTLLTDNDTELYCLTGVHTNCFWQYVLFYSFIFMETFITQPDII